MKELIAFAVFQSQVHVRQGLISFIQILTCHYLSQMSQLMKPTLQANANETSLLIRRINHLLPLFQIKAQAI